MHIFNPQDSFPTGKRKIKSEILSDLSNACATFVIFLLY